MLNGKSQRDIDIEMCGHELTVYGNNHHMNTPEPKPATLPEIKTEAMVAPLESEKLRGHIEAVELFEVQLALNDKKSTHAFGIN